MYNPYFVILSQMFTIIFMLSSKTLNPLINFIDPVPPDNTVIIIYVLYNFIIKINLCFYLLLFVLLVYHLFYIYNF